MQEKRLKKDLFGEIWCVQQHQQVRIVRDTRQAKWWLRWIARWLLRREASSLAAISEVDNTPDLLAIDEHTLTRSYIEGQPMYVAKPDESDYFKQAAKLLRRLHRANVAHNDLAKEPNILVQTDGQPAFIDFQLAWHSHRRGRVFRVAAREDIRHLLKHKRTYRPDLLTARERRILDSPSPVSRLYMATLKPLYRMITRRILGWSDREGAADR